MGLGKISRQTTHLIRHNTTEIKGRVTGLNTECNHLMLRVSMAQFPQKRERDKGLASDVRGNG